MSETKVMKDTIPLWLAVAITVLITMPLALWLGKFSFTMWVAFIVWAEYFALGAKPAGLKLILPSFAYSAALTALTLFFVPFLSFLPSLVTPGDLGVSLALFVGIGFMVYSMRWSKTFQDGSLPFFNGIAMTLAVYFSNSYPQIATPAMAPLWAGCWVILMGILGAYMGVFNVWLLLPREVESQH